jgi:hypothetical protein
MELKDLRSGCCESPKWGTMYRCQNHLFIFSTFFMIGLEHVLISRLLIVGFSNLSGLHIILPLDVLSLFMVSKCSGCYCLIFFNKYKFHSLLCYLNFSLHPFLYSLSLSFRVSFHVTVLFPNSVALCQSECYPNSFFFSSDG